MSMSKKVDDSVRFALAMGSVYDDGDPITHLKLQKLLYYFQGFHLAATKKKPLFPENIVAWVHGPVVREVWDEYKRFGSQVLSPPESRPATSLSEYQMNLMTSVYEAYGQFSPWKLRNLTHEERPWKEAFSQGRGTIISHDAMAEFFFPRLS